MIKFKKNKCIRLDKLTGTGALIVMKKARKHLVLLRINVKQKFLIEIVSLIKLHKRQEHIIAI